MLVIIIAIVRVIIHCEVVFIIIIIIYIIIYMNARGGRYCRTCRHRGCGRHLILSCSKRKCRLHMRGFWHELFLTILKLCFDPFALHAIFTWINNNNIQAPGSPPELRLNYFFDREIRSVGIFRADKADRSGKNK